MDREQEEQILASIAASKSAESLRAEADDIAIVQNGDFSGLHRKVDALETKSLKRVWRVNVGICTYLFHDYSFDLVKQRLWSL